MLNSVSSFSFFSDKMKVLVIQSCPTLCDAMDGSLPGSSVHVICQARVLAWGAITFSGSRVYLTIIWHMFHMSLLFLFKCFSQLTLEHEISILYVKL